jgi:hypothetical protein
MLGILMVTDEDKICCSIIIKIMNETGKRLANLSVNTAEPLNKIQGHSALARISDYTYQLVNNATEIQLHPCNFIKHLGFPPNHSFYPAIT